MTESGHHTSFLECHTKGIHRLAVFLTAFLWMYLVSVVQCFRSEWAGYCEWGLWNIFSAIMIPIGFILVPLAVALNIAALLLMIKDRYSRYECLVLGGLWAFIVAVELIGA
jgi:hypothetical protein